MEESERGIDADDLATIADDIPAGVAAMLLVVEHTGVIPLRDAMVASGGTLSPKRS